MFEKINASKFVESESIYKAELLSILSMILNCQQHIAKLGVKIPNHEEKIRDYLYINYLNSQDMLNRFDLKYHFECEPKEFGTTLGYLDLKVFNQNIFDNPEQYFIIECKRLNNRMPKTKDGLNGKYIGEGIIRFVEKKYSTFHQLNGMIAFIVDEFNPDKSVKNINHLLKNKFPDANTLNNLRLSYGDIYSSYHNDKDGSAFTLLHLFLDFSKIAN